MLLITYAKRLSVTRVAGVVVPERGRRVEVPGVYTVGAVLLTRPKVEVQSKSEGFGG